MAVDEKRFNAMTQVVIDKLEGGYYHPDMLKDGRVKDARYGTSGETMFGIDRRQGGSINDTIAGKKFWGIIDQANARSNWKWNYKGGELSNQLKPLVSQMMLPQYENLANRYLSPQSKAIVDNDNRLLFHFIYGTWNGSGWFKKFADDINKSVAKGQTNPDELVKVAISSRTQEGLKAGSSPNSLIAQGGNKIANFINTLGGSTKEFAKKNPLTTIAVTALITVGIWILIKQFKNKN